MSPFQRLHPAVQHHVVNALGWPALRPMQERAIEPILSGAHALVLAPTAGGKTEAAALPLFSRMLTEGWNGLSVLYVCPIKALLNNLEPRLSRLAGLLGRRAALWHGDVGPTLRRRLQRDPPDLLLTTPESIEAMLVSSRVDHAAFFGDVRAIVIDELHAFAGDDRGWHLLALLERLSRLAGRPIQRIGLSATVGNPGELLEWLAAHAPGERVVLAPEAGGTAAADVKVDSVGSLDNAALVLARLYRGEKRLVFCDSRSRTEALAAALRGRGVRTFVSHSSLSRDERLQAEAAFTDGSDCVIVATSTLELGIDVGDLDRVIQIDAPSTVAGFLQRLGRTGRRADTTRNCLFLATGADAFLRAAGIVQLWSAGYVEPVRPPPQPWHLLGQQLLALCLQETRLPFDAWRGWIGTLPAFQGQQAASVLEHMLRQGLVAEDGGWLSVGPEGERLFGRRHFLDLVAVFATQPLFTVRAGRQDLGQVHALSFAAVDGRPTVLLLGGRGWVVTALGWNARIAWVEPTEDVGRSRWEGSSRSMDASLCRAIRRVLAGADVDSWLSKRGRALLAELREDWSWVEEGTTALVLDAKGSQRWWTFAGARVNAGLAAALERSGIAVRRHDNMAIDLPASVEAPVVRRLDAADAVPKVSDEALEDLKFGECLPPDLLTAMVSARFSDAGSVAATLREPVRQVRLALEFCPHGIVF